MKIKKNAKIYKNADFIKFSRELSVGKRLLCILHIDFDRKNQLSNIIIMNFVYFMRFVTQRLGLGFSHVPSRPYSFSIPLL